MKAIIAILAVILALVLAASVFFYMDGNKAKAEISRLTAEIQRRIQTEVDKTRTECEQKAREERKAFEGQLAGVKTLLAEAEKRFAQAQGRVTDAERKAAEQRKLAEDLARKLGIEKAELEKRLRTPGQQPQEVKVAERGGRLEVTVADRILFESGSDRLRNEGMEVLKKIADSLRGDTSKEIQVVGHTDNMPIRQEFRGTFGSNWELSANRAIAAVRYLEQACKIPGERLSARGLGQTRPVDSNETEEGRAKNRRIEILLVPPDGK